MMNQKNIALNHSGNLEALGKHYYDLMFHEGLVANRMSGEVINTLKSGDDASGGYFVPDSMEQRIIHGLAENNVVRRLAKVIHTDGSDRSIPVISEMSDPQWLAEGAEMQFAKATLGNHRLKQHKLGMMVQVSNELLNDGGVDIPGMLEEIFVKIVSAEENAFLNGDGLTMPRGLLNSATVGVSAAAADAITAEEILRLYASLDEKYRANAAFMMHEETANALRLLKDESGRYLWREALGGGKPDRLLGRPVYTSRFMPGMAAGARPVLFGDFSKYWIADRGNRSLSRYNELFADYGLTGFRMVERVDGGLILPDAVKVIQMATE